MTDKPPFRLARNRRPVNHWAPVFFCFLLGGAAAQAGQIYKWVDEQGKSHFGDRPQKDVTTQEVQLKPLNSVEGPKAARQEQQQKLLESYDRSREEKAKTDEEQKRQQAQKNRQCDKMRQTLEYYERSSLMFEEQANGGRRYLDNKQRDTEVANLKAAIARDCR